MISPKFFLVTACFVCSLTSISTGTSWGTVIILIIYGITGITMAPKINEDETQVGS